MSSAAQKQNLTIRLQSQTIRKAKVLAAERSLSISGLVEEQIESLVGKQEVYERSRTQALALMERGFAMGGKITATRDELHER